MENGDGTVTYLQSDFERYKQEHLNKQATRYVLSPRLYSSLELSLRKEHKGPQCSWALCKQSTNMDWSHMYLNNRFHNYVYVTSMSNEEFDKYVKTIGGIPYSSFYIHYNNN